MVLVVPVVMDGDGDGDGDGENLKDIGMVRSGLVWI